MKLGYWKIQGLAQPIRMIIAANKLDVELKDYESREEWFEKDKKAMATKPFSFFPNLPYLVIKDGALAMTQSRAILTFLGKQTKMVPQDDMEEVRLEVMYGNLDDLWKKMMKLVFLNKEDYEANKAKTLEEMIEFFKKFDNYYSKHKYTCTDRAGGISWVDFHALHIFNIVRRFSSKLAEFENVNKFVDNLVNELGEDFKKWFDGENANRALIPAGFSFQWAGCGVAPDLMEAESF